MNKIQNAALATTAAYYNEIKKATQMGINVDTESVLTDICKEKFEGIDYSGTDFCFVELVELIRDYINHRISINNLLSCLVVY